MTSETMRPETTHSPAAGPPHSGLWLVGLAAMLWGTGGAVAKQLFLISALDPMEVGFYRLAIAVPALLLFGGLWRRRSRLRVGRAHVWPIVGLALATALYQLAYYNAVDLAGVTVATVITICMAPPLVAVSSGYFLTEAVGRRTQLAMGVTIGGTALLIGWPGSSEKAAAAVIDGSLLALCAAASYAAMVLLSRRLAPHHDPYQLIILGFGGGAVILLPVFIIQGPTPLPSLEAAGLLLFLGAVPTAVAYVFFFIGMRSAPAAASSVISLLEPLVATLLGLVVFYEKIGAAGSVGIGLMVSGLLILGGNPSGRRGKGCVDRDVVGTRSPSAREPE